MKLKITSSEANEKLLTISNTKFICDCSSELAKRPAGERAAPERAPPASSIHVPVYGPLVAVAASDGEAQ